MDHDHSPVFLEDVSRLPFQPLGPIEQPPVELNSPIQVHIRTGESSSAGESTDEKDPALSKARSTRPASHHTPSDNPYSIRKSVLNGSEVSMRPARVDLDAMVPVTTGPPRRHTLEERLEPVILVAAAERQKYAMKAQATAYALNIAIGLQILLGTLTTALSAVTSGRQTSIMTSILGGMSTVVAAYLARARGSGEPEMSNMRCKSLEKFLRECEAFKMDRGHVVDGSEDVRLAAFRYRLEELLGNTTNERKGETGTSS